MAEHESAEQELARRFEQHRGRLRRLAYRMLGSLSEADDAVQETWLRLAGSHDPEIENLGETNTYEDQPAWSPDGTRIAYRFMNDAQDTISSVIHVMNADGTNRLNLTPAMLSNRDPTWSPAGTQIAFRGLSSDGSGIHVMNADGSNQVRITVSADSNPAWSPRP